jgi:acetoin utilization protein AcuB
MLVGERMSRHPSVIRPDTTVADALKRMREENVRRFPVLDPGTDKLVGIVTEKELLYASPSPATSLSVHELHYLLSKLTVGRIMTTDLVIVAEDTLIEEAALIMIDRGVGALPVMRDGQLVGIVTETDLFKTFVELFAARKEGVRLTLLVPNTKGQFVAIVQAIAKTGGHMIALGTFDGEDMDSRLLTVKVVGAPRTVLVGRLQDLGIEVVDARQCLQSLAC